MDKIYLVKYCGGSYEDHYSTTIFATTKKTTAEKYVAKFNRLLKKWRDYYKTVEFDVYFESLKKWEDYRYLNHLEGYEVERHFRRWGIMNEVTECYYEEVNSR